MTVNAVTCSAHHGDGQDDGGEVLEVCHSSPTGSLVDGVDQVTEGSCQREDHQHLGSGWRLGGDGAMCMKHMQVVVCCTQDTCESENSFTTQSISCQVCMVYKH